MSDTASEERIDIKSDVKYSKLLKFIAAKMRVEDGRSYSSNQFCQPLGLKVDEVKELAEIIKNKEKDYKLSYVRTKIEDCVYDIEGTRNSCIPSNCETDVIYLKIIWSKNTHGKDFNSKDGKVSWIYEYIRPRQFIDL